jgi:hypothetical protein
LGLPKFVIVKSVTLTSVSARCFALKSAIITWRGYKRNLVNISRKNKPMVKPSTPLLL